MNLHPGLQSMMAAAGGLTPFVARIFDYLHEDDGPYRMSGDLVDAGIHPDDYAAIWKILRAGYTHGYLFSAFEPGPRLSLWDRSLEAALDRMERRVVKFRPLAEWDDLGPEPQRYLVARSQIDGTQKCRLAEDRCDVGHDDLLLRGERVVGAGFIRREGNRIIVDGNSYSFVTRMDAVGSIFSACPAGLGQVRLYLEGFFEKKGRNVAIELIGLP